MCSAPNMRTDVRINVIIRVAENRENTGVRGKYNWVRCWCREDRRFFIAFRTNKLRTRDQYIFSVSVHHLGGTLARDGKNNVFFWKSLKFLKTNKHRVRARIMNYGGAVQKWIFYTVERWRKRRRVIEKLLKNIRTTNATVFVLFLFCKLKFSVICELFLTWSLFLFGVIFLLLYA